VGRALPSSPSRGQGRLPPARAAQSPGQPGLACLRGWGISHLSEQPLPASPHPQHNQFLPYFQSESPLFQLKTIAPRPVAAGPAEEPGPVFLLSTGGCREVSPQPSPPAAPALPAEGFQPPFGSITSSSSVQGLPEMEVFSCLLVLFQIYLQEKGCFSPS